MNIGTVKLSSPTVLAPMAGITDMPFRRLVKQTGCALVCSEMVSANGLIYGQNRTHEYLYRTASEKPFSVQIFGRDPAIMAEAATIVAASGADILDINFGCSVRKILKNGYGSALMKDMAAAEALLTAVRKVISIPLTIKIRTGWDPSGEDALELARVAEACGVDAICIHPRTAPQLFRGSADWSIIAKLKQQVRIPVIGNGDISDEDDALRMLSETGCDGVMIGRATLSNPWIFSRVLARMNGQTVPELSRRERFEGMGQYINDAVACYGEDRASRMMRSRLGWLVKGLPHAARFREQIKAIASREDALAVVEEYFSRLSAYEDEAVN